MIRLYEIDKKNPKSSEEIRLIIEGFVANSDSIFFVHRYPAWKSIESRIIHDAEQNREYIALHSLGSATKRARNIDRKVNQKLVNMGYTSIPIRNDKKEFSRVWYRDKGIEVYKLLLEVI